MSSHEVIKRDGRREPYDIRKIEQAVYKCMHDGLEQGAASSTYVSGVVADQVHERLLAADAWPVHIEAVQDMVEEELIAEGQVAAARAYIKYRALHEEKRLRSVSSVSDDLVEQVTAAVRRAADELEDVSIELVIRESLKKLFPGATPADVSQAMVLAARSLVERDPNYSYLAARLLLEHAYSEALQRPITIDEMHAGPYQTHFADYVRQGVEYGRLDPELLTYDLEALAEALDPSCDFLFKYFGAYTVYDRYLLHEEGRRFELPQWFWMRVAMGLAKTERPEDRTEWTIRFYQLMSQHRYCPSTPTLFNAGTCSPQLSSCFLLDVQDDLSDILLTPWKAGMLSKWSGGLGIAVQKIRGLNAQINGTNGKSSGEMPWLKIYDATCQAVDQGGRRRGAWVVYLEPWHWDVEEFLEGRRNTGDERRRVKQMNIALWTNDLFWERLAEDGMWSLFSPDETPELPELYGGEFNEKYREYEAKGLRGELRLFRQMKAKDLARKIIQMVFETGHPWITFKDAFNLRSPQDHVGTLHSTNLCTEIGENTGIPKLVPYSGPQERFFLETVVKTEDLTGYYRPGTMADEEVAVCNLGSYVIPSFMVFNEDTGDYYLDEAALLQTTPTVIRMLDNVIDQNLYPIPQAERSNKRHRPVGLGMMGLHDALFMQNIPFESELAVWFSDRLWEVISYGAISASCQLAAERGSYPSFPGSKWNRGILPIDSYRQLAEYRGDRFRAIERESLDWAELRERARQGMRNSNLMALAPTATIGNIIGVSPVSEPYQYNLYVESTMSGDFTQINEHLILRLKSLNLWNLDTLNDLKFANGSVQELEYIPEHIRLQYKTAFEINPEWVIRAAAARQKWIDQAQSTNIWFRGKSMRALLDTYTLAWEYGLKSTYYLRTESATEIEKTTIDVNRYGAPTWMKNQSETANVLAAAREGEAEVKLCRINDPTCDSCQ
jgi:ribonucleoside-diphosphate reductase alpha chain